MSDKKPVPLAEFVSQHLCPEITKGQSFLLGAGASLAAAGAIELLRKGNLFERTKQGVFSLVRMVAGAHIKKELDKEVAGMTFRKMEVENYNINDRLPEKAMTRAEVFDLAKQLREKMDEDWKAGHMSGTVYHGGKDLTDLINDVLVLYQWTNPLHMDSFGSLRQMESEIIAMCVDLFHGSPRFRDKMGLSAACGGVTSGGTDSICMAMKSYREYAKEKRGITRPNIVIPVTGHPAFDKACHYYGIQKVEVPVISQTGVVDPEELEKHITADTICIVGSAVNYPYGTCDDIEALSEIALKHGCGLHVDCCLGGFVIQFLEDAGIKDVPIVDFRVPGVTSISVDTHKFGFAPKGSSVVLFDSYMLRRYMYFSIASWPGGLYASPGYNGSRPGNIIAGTWAAMMAMGKDGYIESSKAIYLTMSKFVNGIKKIPGLHVIGNPQTSAVAFTSDEVDVYELQMRVTKRYGWQLHTLQFPHAIQFSLTWVHSQDGIIEKMLRDIEAVQRELLAENEEKKKKGERIKLADESACMYGTQQKIPDRSLIDEVTKMYLDKYYQAADVVVVNEKESSANSSSAAATAASSK